MTRIFRIGIEIPAALAAAALAGCSVNTEEIATAFVRSEKYDLYSCQQILDQTRLKAGKIEELRGLIEKAGRGAGGEVAVALAYRTEYLTNYGELRTLQDTAVRKNCDDRSRSISERSVW